MRSRFFPLYSKGFSDSFQKNAIAPPDHVFFRYTARVSAIQKKRDRTKHQFWHFFNSTKTLFQFDHVFSSAGSIALQGRKRDRKTRSRFFLMRSRFFRRLEAPPYKEENAIAGVKFFA